MDSALRVLHLEDNAADTELVQATLEAEGIPSGLTRVENAQDFLAALRKGDVDLVLADYTLPAFDGISALMLAQRHAADVPFIFVSGTLGEEVAIEALKLGATDYVLKTRLGRLGPSVNRALREAHEKKERRRAEQALRDSEEQWKAAFESNPVMYFMADRTGKTLSVNVFGADQLGYKSSELVGQSLLNVFYEADREQVRKDVENCFQNLGRTFKWEARKVRKDGTVIWVRETANALLLKNRPVLLVVCEDITDRKRAEEAARRSEKELRDVFETIPAMAWSALPDGSVDFMNRAWQDYTGLSMDKALGRSSEDIIHPGDQARTIAEWKNGLKNGQPIETELRLRRADGVYRSWFVRNVPLRDEHGNIVKWYGTAIDIEDRKRAEEAVHRSEKQLRDLIETIPAMAFVTRPDGSNEFVSRKWIEFSGLSAEQSAGSGWEVTLHPDDLVEHVATWRAAWTSGKPFESEARHRDAHGNYRWLLVRAVPLRSEQGRILKWYGTAIDIEDRKRAEEALRASEQRLRDVIGNAPVILFSLDRFGVINLSEGKGLDAFGVKPGQLVGKSIFDLYHDSSGLHASARRALSGEAVTFVTEFNNQFFEIHLIPRLDDGGEVAGVTGVTYNITDRRRTERELRLVIDTIPAMSWSTLADGAVDYCSKGWVEYTGMKSSEAAGSAWLKAYHPEDRGAHMAKWRASTNSGELFKSEARILGVDGKYRWFLTQGVPLRDESGKIIRWYGTNVDIDERKRAEEALRASEQLARSHVEVMMRSLDVLATEAAPEKLIAEMLRTIGQRLHARSVLLWLRDPQDDSLHLRLVIDDGRQVAPHQDHPFVKDPHSWKRNLPFQDMFFTKGPVVCDDLEQDSRIGAELREYMMKRGRKRFLAIPMFMLGEVRGFIGIQHSEQGAYRAEEIELAQALAHHVMIATHEDELGEQRRHAVVLEERTRMARDIHDTLAQGFTGVIVQLDTAVEALRDEEPEAAAKHIRRARELARESLTEARRSVHALRPQALEKGDFADALKAIITNTTAGTSLQSDFQLNGEPRELQPSVEENLLHIGQEALTNALRHAGATKFQARLSFDSDAVRLELRDNGKGFTIDNANRGGIGLIGMKERAEQIGATLAITSEPGAGTTIIAVSPTSSQ